MQVSSAPITNGDLGSFTNIATLSARRDAAVVIVAHDKLHVIGGNGGGQTIETATINADGSLSTFTASTASLTTTRFNSVSAVIGRNLYIIGGNNPTAIGTIERATISSDGTLGAFAAYGKSLTSARACATSAVVGNRLHVIGGNTAFGGAVGVNVPSNEVSILE